MGQFTGTTDDEKNANKRRIFYIARNNGVIAVISAQHARMEGENRAAKGDWLARGVKVFTFSDRDCHCNIVTGTHADLDWLVEKTGIELVDGGSPGWSGYVPFSNGLELGDGAKAEAELRYRTTLTDLRKIMM